MFLQWPEVDLKPTTTQLRRTPCSFYIFIHFKRIINGSCWALAEVYTLLNAIPLWPDHTAASARRHQIISLIFKRAVNHNSWCKKLETVLDPCFLLHCVGSRMLTVARWEQERGWFIYGLRFRLDQWQTGSTRDWWETDRRVILLPFVKTDNTDITVNMFFCTNTQMINLSVEMMPLTRLLIPARLS